MTISEVLQTALTAAAPVAIIIFVIIAGVRKRLPTSPLLDGTRLLVLVFVIGAGTGVLGQLLGAVVPEPFGRLGAAGGLVLGLMAAGLAAFGSDAIKGLVKPSQVDGVTADLLDFELPRASLEQPQGDQS